MNPAMPPPPDPIADQTFAGVVACLTHAHDGRRRAAVAVLAATPHTGLQRVVIDRLVGCLVGPVACLREPAAASLVELGPVSAPALIGAVMFGRPAALRLRALELLTRIGPRLAQADYAGLLSELRRATDSAADGAAGGAGDRAGVLVGQGPLTGGEDDERDGAALL
jgi:hypothetical protein